MTELINNFIDFVVELVMFVVPEITLAPDIISNIGEYMEIAIDILKKVNFLIPVPLIFQIVGLIVTFKVLSVAIWGTNWVIKRIFDVIP